MRVQTPRCGARARARRSALLPLHAVLLAGVAADAINAAAAVDSSPSPPSVLPPSPAGAGPGGASGAGGTSQRPAAAAAADSGEGAPQASLVRRDRRRRERRLALGHSVQDPLLREVDATGRSGDLHVLTVPAIHQLKGDLALVTADRALEVAARALEAAEDAPIDTWTGKEARLQELLQENQLLKNHLASREATAPADIPHWTLFLAEHDCQPSTGWKGIQSSVEACQALCGADGLAYTIFAADANCKCAADCTTGTTVGSSRGNGVGWNIYFNIYSKAKGRTTAAPAAPNWRYQKNVVGKKCTAWSLIVHQEECELAAVKLKFPIKQSRIVARYWRNRVPAGCYYETSRCCTGLWFNPQLNSTSDGEEVGNSPVCREPPPAPPLPLPPRPPPLTHYAEMAPAPPNPTFPPRPPAHVYKDAAPASPRCPAAGWRLACAHVALAAYLFLP